MRQRIAVPRPWRVCLLLLLCGVCREPAASVAEEGAAPEIAGVRVGFARRYKVGLWTPVEVTLGNGGRPIAGRLTLTIPDGDGVPSRVSVPVQRDQTSVVLYARFGRVESELCVELEVEGSVVARRVFRPTAQRGGGGFLPGIAATRKMIVSVAADSLGVDDAIDLLRQEARQRPAVVRLPTPEELPNRWYGYETVDTLVLSTSRPETFADSGFSAAQADALDRWVRMGGRLVLCVGSQAEKVLAKDAPLGRFAPGRLVEMFPLRQTEIRALETYAGGSTAIARPAGDASRELRVPQLADARGVIRAGEKGFPLVVRTARGFGQVVFLAADLDQPPLSRWKDRPRLVRRLLGFPAARAEDLAEGAAIMHYGFNDMAGQLRSALDQFGTVRVVPFWVVAALALVYVLVVGPGDYFLLRKAGRRMLWTWVTFPVIVLGFSLAAYALAYHLKGDRVRVNQVDLVDVDAESGSLRGTSWMNVFSPRMEAFDLSLSPNSLGDSPSSGGRASQGDSVLFAWLGLPGGALGGMSSRAANPVQWSEQYRFSPQLNALEGVPIPVWSTKSFTARWQAPAEACMEARLTGTDQAPTGTITNTLSFPLLRCTLAYKHWSYDLGDLEPGQSFRLGLLTPRSALKTLLTGLKAVKWKGVYHQQATPYDQSSVDVPYILRTMMFFDELSDAGGGRRYTGLANGYQRFVDLSDLLDTDRAILVAQGPTAAGSERHGAKLLRDGKPLLDPEGIHLTFFRFVFPVGPSHPDQP